MPKSRFTWTVLLIGSLVLGMVWILRSRESVQMASAAGAAAEAPVVGYTAPDFTLETLNGEQFTLSEFRGKPVVLNFWATWCPPCRVEIPFFQATSRKYNGQIVVVGVDNGEARSSVADYAATMNMAYTIPLDTEGVVSRRYHVNSLPTTFFIDSGGVVQSIHIGILNQAILEEQIQQLLR